MLLDKHDAFAALMGWRTYLEATVSSESLHIACDVAFRQGLTVLLDNQYSSKENLETQLRQQGQPTLLLTARYPPTERFELISGVHRADKTLSFLLLILHVVV